MLKQMLIQGLVAAALVGGAAAVYAQAQGNGYLSAPAQVQTKGAEGAMTEGDKRVREDHQGRKHGPLGESHAKGQGRDGDDD
jgi:hypothetical protein